MEPLPNDIALVAQPRVCRILDISRNGLRLLRAKDPSFPIPIKFGSSRQAAVYFDATELRTWIDLKKQSRLATNGAN